MPRQTLNPGEPSVIVGAKMPESVARLIDGRCRQLGITRSEFVRCAVEEYMEFLDDFVAALREGKA